MTPPTSCACLSLLDRLDGRVCAHHRAEVEDRAVRTAAKLLRLGRVHAALATLKAAS